ncbi:hypothetical protein KX729_24070 [Rhizobium sp. XQZ8]|uniref:hypothetical protein n=1 Tax=Rhizobium populisoli TaxID=2859785 RepID=UPI001CA4DADD|nr:hypothetical protein [Rhizobium populisoli]MBW6424531.1 hypothetical protein [Rhizobium populisoli]
MAIDYRILNGPGSSRSFDFIPSMHGQHRHDRGGPDSFHIHEEAFLFLEGIVAEVFPDWHTGYHHWGLSSFSREIWFDILSGFPELRSDIRSNMRYEKIVRKYVPIPALLPRRLKFHRKALLRFLDEFEERVRNSLERYSYMLISGV